jgi:hypothetical protein
MVTAGTGGSAKQQNLWTSLQQSRKKRAMPVEKPEWMYKR